MNPNELVDVVKEGLSGLTKDFSGFKGDIGERITAIEQRLSKSTVNSVTPFSEIKSLGELITENEQCKSFLSGGHARSGKISAGGTLFKTAIVSSGDLFSQAQRVSPISATYQRLTVRDLLRTSSTTSNAIEFVRETSSTNAAAPQGKGSSPQVYENVAKAESAMGFTLVNIPVQTVAHWIPASRQVLDDSAMLRTFIDGRMLHFLKVKEEDQLLNGSGAGGDLYGIIGEATAFDTGESEVGDTQLDTIRRAMKQVQVSGFSVNGVVLHPTDWAEIELIKTTGTASSGEYVASNPRSANPPSVWGAPVVLSQSITEGDFLVGDFQMGAELFDRQQSSIEVSREHSDFFIKNMIAVLAEERLALCVYQGSAFRTGSF
jgi:HK97 family phage major capsid protein